MTRYEERQKENTTTQERTLKLNLSDADVRRISEKAGAHGLTVSALIENFISDLVGGTHSNGSDEQDYAENWFYRCWFGMFPDSTFLRYLIEWGNVYHALELWDDIQEAREDIAAIEKCPEDYDECELPAIQEDMEYWQEQLTEYFTAYRSEAEDPVDSSLEEGMKKILAWREENSTLMKPVPLTVPTA